jgi:DNA-binding NarL/FixJ family response regulator
MFRLCREAVELSRRRLSVKAIHQGTVMAKKHCSLSRTSRVLIVEDHPMMRVGLVTQISDTPDLEVCAEAETAREAIAAIETTNPDLAIIDISLKDSHGLDLIKDVQTRFPRVKVLVLSAFEESLYAERALRAGAMGYVNKQQASESILDAIRAVLSGKHFLSREMMQRVVGQAVGHAGSTVGSPVDTLSDRELEVFEWIGKGQTTSAIARKLHLSPHTVDTHRERIKKKLGLANSNELQREAAQWLLENR